MASCSSVSEDLTCSICLTIFNDPVTIPCGHSFCRECITLSLKSQQQCPQCRTIFPEETRLTTSHILKSLAESAKEKRKEHGHDKEVPEWFCPEHEEKLKLFCVTDQQLTCIICRDGEKHEGHKFKPIKEAAASLRKEVETLMQQVSGDVTAVEKLEQTQKEEIRKTKVKSLQLMELISNQFEEMHQILKKKEDEIKKQLRQKEMDEVQKMTDSLNAIETALKEGREADEKMKPLLEMTESESFLQSWSEVGTTMKNNFRPRARNLQVVAASLSMGPYESHLKFFTWKEMFQEIQPQPEQLSLQSPDVDLIVSDDGRSVLLTCQQCLSKMSRRQKLQQLRQQQLQQQLLQQLQQQLRQQQLLQKLPQLPRQQQQIRQLQQLQQQQLQLEQLQNLLEQQSNKSHDDGNPLSSVTSTSAAPVFGQTSHDEPYASVFSTNVFTSGQHYWEIDVGLKDYWEVGLQNHFLNYHNGAYFVSNRGLNENIQFQFKPRRIGVYLNCSSKELSFYDADNMKHIHTLTLNLTSVSESAYLRISTSGNNVPVSVCCY